MSTKKKTVGIVLEQQEYADLRLKILFGLSSFFNVIVFTHEKNDIGFFKEYPDIKVVPMKFFGFAPLVGFSPSPFSPTNVKYFCLDPIREHVSKCDVIITHEVYSSYSYYFLLQAKRIKPSILCVPMVYETLPRHVTRYLPPFSCYQRCVIKHADAFWAFTDQTSNYLRAIGVPQRKIFRVYQGVVLPNRSAMEGSKRSGTIRILFCGRLTKQKGIDQIATAFDALSRYHSNIELHICGEGPLRSSIEALHNSRIALHGFVSPERMGAFYQEADIFCLMSQDFYRFGMFHMWEEQLGNVLIEAMAYGIPIVTSDNGAIPEIVGRHNLICDNPSDLEDTLERLIQDPSLRDRIGSMNRVRAEEYFDLSRNTELLAKELLNRLA